MSEPLTLRSRSSAIDWQAAIGDEPVFYVPTMGALHAGHLSLIQAAHKLRRDKYESVGKIIVSIFVNPTQFTESSDLHNYPKPTEQDLQICAEANVDAVFVPEVIDVYPEGLESISLLDAGVAGLGLEADSRPQHFAGVVTVLARLFEIVQPTVAFFGEKDYQQLIVVKDFVQRNNLPIEIVAVPTVRESDGVALSSRNQRLSITGRAFAKQIPAAFALAEHALTEGHKIAEVIEIVSNFLQMQPEITFDYFEILSNDLSQVSSPGPARMLIAVQIQNVRLIDNVPVEIGKENVTGN